MNIGIDIDDTITYTYETLVPIIALRYGLNISKMFRKRPTYKVLETTLPNYDNFVINNFSTLAKMVPLKEGVVDILKRLKEQGHKIIFITARNYKEYNDPYLISKNYLDLNGIPYDKLIVNSLDKGKDCLLENIDIFIDDNVDNCKNVNSVGVNTWQFDTIFAEKISGIDRVYSWEEVYNKIQKMMV